jgi:exonuclease VII small subunit
MMAATRSDGSTAGGADPPATQVGELSYSSAGMELDAIIEEFETGVIDVDRLVVQLERATEIVDELDRRLRRTRMRVEELVPRLEAIGRDEAIGVESDLEDLPDGDQPSSDEEDQSPGLF